MLRGTREEPGTLTQGVALFSLVPLVWESNPKLHGGWCKSNHQPSGDLEPTQENAFGVNFFLPEQIKGIISSLPGLEFCVCT